MKLIINGVYRHRIRTKILWFWVVGPWKEDAFTFEQAVPDQGFSYMPIKGVPLSVALRPYTGNIVVSYEGFGLLNVPIPAVGGAAAQMTWEPVKGNIFMATLAIE